MKNSCLKIFLAVLCGLFMLACGKDKENSPNIQEFDLSISHSSVNITEGKTFLLAVNISPDDIEHPSISWSSSNSAVAAVDDTGLVSALVEGEAVITAAFANNAKKVICNVSVCKASGVSYTVALDKTSAMLTEGKTMTLIATVTPQLSNDIQLMWYSSNQNIASVDASGVIKGVKEGETSVYAMLSDGTVSELCAIKVYRASAYDYKYRLVLKDKGATSYSTGRPEEFLSQRSIQRRNTQNITIDETDLPISDEYIGAIKAVGGGIVAKSKWLNTVVVHCTEPYMLEEYKKLPFVEDAVYVWRGTKAKAFGLSSISKTKLAPDKMNVSPALSKTGKSHYGYAWGNIENHKGNEIHDSGYRGNGIEVAVIDAGFINVPTLKAAGNMRIKGTKSFIYNDERVYDNTDAHGTWVLTTMAYNKPGTYVGSAPEASYWLLRTEDVNSEFPVEEDYWIAAIEFADSVGVDIVNTSLGYEYFDDSSLNYKLSDSDGKTAPMSRAADIAVAKGIDIVVSAGNSGHYVLAPGDAHNILTVGSVGKDGSIASSSSNGITVDGRVKPDVVGLGNPACVIETNNNIAYYGGTSFSSPIVCGLTACLRQAYPTLTSKELLNVMKKSGDRAAGPQPPYGCGIPDMQKAMQLAKAIADSK